MATVIGRVRIRPAVAATCVGLTVVAVAACKSTATAWTDKAAHKNGFVTANGIRINYLDWGGSGKPLILIHGMGDNPHVFDDIAPAFTDHYRVVAYARRGHGDSDAKPPYNVATLTEDLRVLMDSLGIAKADIAGWSMGGDEVTAMAGTHPERVGHIVYLEGAYDWGDGTLAAAFPTYPVALSPPDSAMSSMDAFLTFQGSAVFPGLADMARVEAYNRDLVVVQPDGRLRMKMSDSVSQALFHVVLTERRDYTKVRAPALAIYAQSFVDAQHGSTAQQDKSLAWEQKYMVPFRAASIERVQKELPGVEIVRVSGTHMGFIYESRDQVVASMRKFLGT
jgi:pimeloyl-ACP methyl ester carboxylesterase